MASRAGAGTSPAVPVAAQPPLATAASPTGIVRTPSPPVANTAIVNTPPAGTPARAPSPPAANNSPANSAAPAPAPAPAPAMPTPANANTPAPAANNTQTPATAQAAPAATQAAAVQSSVLSNNASENRSSASLISASAASSAASAASISYSIAPQTIPHGSSDNASGSTANTSSNFPVPAIAVIAIVASLGCLFALYRFYRWNFIRKQRKAAVYPVETVERASVNLSRHVTVPQLAHRASFSYPESVTSHKGGRPGSFYGDDMAPPSPASQHHIPHADSTMSTDYLRRTASRQSLYNIAAGANLATSRSSYPATLYPSAAFSVPRQSRVSGAPHSIHARVEISVPQPLGVPRSVVAHDVTKLDFAPHADVVGTGSLGNLDVSSLRSMTPNSNLATSIDWDGNAHRNPAGAAISAVYRAAYLAHGNRASILFPATVRDVSQDRQSSSGASAHLDDLEEARRTPSERMRDTVPRGTRSSGSASSGATPEHDPGIYRPPSMHLDDLLGGR